MCNQSTSRISGRTQAAISAMCVRALRIRVLKSAGNSPATNVRTKRRERSARQTFFFTRCEICCVLVIFERRQPSAGSENFRLGGSGGLLPQAGLPRKQSVRMSFASFWRYASHFRSTPRQRTCGRTLGLVGKGQSTKSLRSSPLSGSKSRETGSRLRGS